MNVTDRQFSEDGLMDYDFFSIQQFLDFKNFRMKMIYPNRSIGQNHFFFFLGNGLVAGMRKRGGTSRSGMVPPAAARLL